MILAERQRAILVGTKICHETVQEKEIYDATGITISSRNFHTLCIFLRDNILEVLLVKKYI